MREKFQFVIGEMTEEGLAYCIAVLLFLLSLMLLTLNQDWGVSVSPFFMYAASALLIYGFWTYLSPILKKASESILIKGLWAALTIIGTTISISASKVIVNETLQVPSSAFPHTQTLVAVLVAPVVIGFFVVSIGFLLAPAFQVMLLSGDGKLSLKALMLNRSRRSRQVHSDLKYIGRFLAFLLTLVFCLSLLGRTEAYLNAIESSIRWYAFHFETERYSACTLGADAQVSYLPNDTVILATTGDKSYHFKVVKCSADG